MAQKLVKASEVRKLLDVESDARIYDLARRSILPGVVRIGRQVRFDLRKIREFIDAGGSSLSGGWRNRLQNPEVPNSRNRLATTDSRPALTELDCGTVRNHSAVADHS